VNENPSKIELEAQSNFKAPKVKARLTFSQIVALYFQYVKYTSGLKEYGSQHSKRVTIRDVADELKIKKSTIHYYFSKIFPSKPSFLTQLFFLYKKKSLSSLRVRQLSPQLRHEEKKIVDWILRCRQAGIVVTYDDIRERAKENISGQPNLLYSNKWVKNFMKRHNLVLRKATHRTLKNNMTVIKSKIDTFLKNVETFRNKWNYKDELIINFDETAIFFDFEVNTVEVKGKKFVRTLQLGRQKQRLTCGVTICASGDLLPSLIIYNQKGILNCSENDYEHDMRFFYTQSGWINEDIFVTWLQKIIIPYVGRRRALLVFDCYSSHVSKAFQKEIIKHDNLDILLIPGGLTYLLQPLDVSFNHSFKTEVHKEWKSYLSSQKDKILEKQRENQRAQEERKEPETDKNLV